MAKAKKNMQYVELEEKKWKDKLLVAQQQAREQVKKVIEEHKSAPNWQQRDKENKENEDNEEQKSSPVSPASPTNLKRWIPSTKTVPQAPQLNTHARSLVRPSDTEKPEF